MMKSFFPFKNALGPGAVFGVAMACAMFCATAPGRAEGYLAKVGPTPLRYQVLRLEKPLNLAPLPLEPEDKSGNSRTLDLRSNEALAGRASAEIPAEILAPYTMWWSRFAGTNRQEILAQPNPEYLTNSIQAMPPASDLLPVSPEMLVEYFKPVQGPTNSASATVMVPLDFTPAAPVAPRGSSAIYRSP